MRYSYILENKMSDQSKTIVRKSSLKDSKDSKSKAQALVVQVEAPSLHLEPLMSTPVKQPPSKGLGSSSVNPASLWFDLSRLHARVQPRHS